MLIPLGDRRSSRPVNAAICTVVAFECWRPSCLLCRAGTGCSRVRTRWRFRPREGPARQVAYAFAASALLALVVLYMASGSSLSAAPFAFSRTSDLTLGRAAAVAGDYRAVAFKVFIPIERLCILFETVCAGGQN